MAKDKITMTAADISEKWNRSMKNAVPDIQRGIERVSVSPMEKAVAKQDKMLQNLTQSIQSGRWAAGMKNVSLSDWKAKTSSKVGERMASGVDNAMSKRKAFDSWLVPVIQAGMDKVKSMPDMTITDSKNRMNAFIDHMYANKYKQ